MTRFRLLALVPVAAALVAGCGGSASSTPSIQTKRAAGLAFAGCMRANGVPGFPDPGGNGHGGLLVQRRIGSGASLTVNGTSVASAAFQHAMQACRSKLPNGGQPPKVSASQKQAMLRFSQCMRTHGVTNFPDPSFSAVGPGEIRIGGKAGFDPNSPVFQQAQQACGGGKGPFQVAAGPG